jgi:predicted DCC family thiol-disulfide oxidoreductase YuxK
MQVSGTIAQLAQAWRDFWFRDADTVNLEVIRIAVGALLLISYGGLTADLLALYGDQGWLARQYTEQYFDTPWIVSVFHWLHQPWQWYAFHGVFLAACGALMLGWRTSWVKWLVLLGHLSYAHRNLGITYGVDNITASLLFILCLAPIGRALSLDRHRELARAKAQNLDATVPAFTSEWGFACRRLLQIQMVIFFLFSGITKLRGDYWWHGDAFWVAIANYEYANVPIGWLADNYVLVNLFTFGTLAIEISYPFLIWNRRLRPWILAGAVTLHLGIAVLMGLYLFSSTMIVAHSAFLPRRAYAALGRWWRRRTPALEMIYDGQCTFCKRSMAWLLAFDGLGQIRTRDYRTDPSPVVASEDVDKALYVVIDDNRALPGFDAYRYVVARVPGLWWMIPLFYIPLLSRAVGRPVYNWIASHRHVISTCAVSPVQSSDRGG